MHIGLKIKSLVDEKNIRVSELMSVLNVNRQSIYDLYKREDIKTDQLRKIAKFFNLPISYFFEEKAQIKEYQDKKNGNTAEEEGSEYKTLLDNYKTTVEALQSENETLKKLLEMKDEQLEILKNKLKELGNS